MLRIPGTESGNSLTYQMTLRLLRMLMWLGCASSSFSSRMNPSIPREVLWRKFCLCVVYCYLSIWPTSSIRLGRVYAVSNEIKNYRRLHVVNVIEITYMHFLMIEINPSGKGCIINWTLLQFKYVIGRKPCFRVGNLKDFYVPFFFCVYRTTFVILPFTVETKYKSNSRSLSDRSSVPRAYSLLHCYSERRVHEISEIPYRMMTSTQLEI